MSSILTTRKVDVNFNPGSEPIMFRIEGKNIGSLKNFIGLTGLPKNGKGKFAGAIMAAAISQQEVFGLRVKLPEDRTRVAWFATDESEHDLFKSISLVKNLSGSALEHLDVFNVRRDDPFTIKKAITEYLTATQNCALIVVDNIGDLLINYNDEGQSKKLINDLKKWTDESNILLVAILHLGKGNNTTLGHLGAGLDRYAQSVLRVERDKERNVYTLTGNMLRSAAEFSPIDILYDAGADTWKQVYHENAAPKLKTIIASPGELDISEHRATLRQIFNSQGVQSYNLLLNNMKIFYGRAGTWCKQCINHVTREGLLINGDNGFTLATQPNLFKIQK